MRLVFLGTPGFAVPTLEACVRAGHEVATVLLRELTRRATGRPLESRPFVNELAGRALA